MDLTEKQFKPKEPLHDTVEQTKALYHGAREAFERLMEGYKGQAVHPDLTRAIRVELVTLLAYNRALIRLNRLILHCETPDDAKPKIDDPGPGSDPGLAA